MYWVLIWEILMGLELEGFIINLRGIINFAFVGKVLSRIENFKDFYEIRIEFLYCFIFCLWT